jgi:5-methylcytosine-specific restriction endonuclease McrA
MELRALLRDGWVCGICKGEIDPEKVWPDRGAFSLDHIVPLARGGKHVLENVQPAHSGCNHKKAATL